MLLTPSAGDPEHKRSKSRTAQPVIVWFRRDLRLADHPALTAATAAGAPVIPVFVLDPETEALGAASKWRLGRSLADLAARLKRRGLTLTLRRGPALDVLRSLVAETGAAAVHWSRLYAPDWVARDKAVKARLTADGIAVESHPGHLIHEPWAVATRSGGPFKVFGAFWRAMRMLEVPSPLRTPQRLVAPGEWPVSDRLEEWRLDAAVDRGGSVLARFADASGEDAARHRLGAFIEQDLAGYPAGRDRPGLSATSRLSAHLTWGEISPNTVWRAASRAREAGVVGAEVFLQELAWREFAWHLLWHTPEIATANWNKSWNGFPWRADSDDAERWRRGETGEPMVDAGMREMFVTGTMHNRARMLVASYLTKHLMTDWKIGLNWFANCLTDWDPAANALNWQWVAGSGPDAAPYFRIFNPTIQAQRFDPDGRYRRRFVAGFDGAGGAEAQAYFEAIPRSWRMSATGAYPKPMVNLHEARARALVEYQAHRAAPDFRLAGIPD